MDSGDTIRSGGSHEDPAHGEGSGILHRTRGPLLLRKDKGDRGWGRDTTEHEELNTIPR